MSIQKGRAENLGQLPPLEQRDDAEGRLQCKNKYGLNSIEKKGRHSVQNMSQYIHKDFINRTCQLVTVVNTMYQCNLVANLISQADDVAF